MSSPLLLVKAGPSLLVTPHRGSVAPLIAPRGFGKPYEPALEPVESLLDDLHRLGRPSPAPSLSSSHPAAQKRTYQYSLSCDEQVVPPESVAQQQGAAPLVGGRSVVVEKGDVDDEVEREIEEGPGKVDKAPRPAKRLASSTLSPRAPNKKQHLGDRGTTSTKRSTTLVLVRLPIAFTVDEPRTTVSGHTVDMVVGPSDKMASLPLSQQRHLIGKVLRYNKEVLGSFQHELPAPTDANVDSFLPYMAMTDIAACAAFLDPTPTLPSPQAITPLDGSSLTRRLATGELSTLENYIYTVETVFSSRQELEKLFVHLESSAVRAEAARQGVGPAFGQFLDALRTYGDGVAPQAREVRGPSYVGWSEGGTWRYEGEAEPELRAHAHFVTDQSQAGLSLAKYVLREVHRLKNDPHVKLECAVRLAFLATGNDLAPESKLDFAAVTRFEAFAGVLRGSSMSSAGLMVVSGGAIHPGLSLQQYLAPLPASALISSVVALADFPSSLALYVERNLPEGLTVEAALAVSKRKAVKQQGVDDDKDKVRAEKVGALVRARQFAKDPSSSRRTVTYSPQSLKQVQVALGTGVDASLQVQIDLLSPVDRALLEPHLAMPYIRPLATLVCRSSGKSRTALRYAAVITRSSIRTGVTLELTATNKNKVNLHEARVVLAHGDMAVLGVVSLSLVDPHDAGEVTGTWEEVGEGEDEEPKFKVARLDGSPVRLRDRKGLSKEDKFVDWAWSAEKMAARFRAPSVHYEGQGDDLRSLMQQILA